MYTVYFFPEYRMPKRYWISQQVLKLGRQFVRFRTYPGRKRPIEGFPQWDEFNCTVVCNPLSDPKFRPNDEMAGLQAIRVISRSPNWKRLFSNVVRRVRLARRARVPGCTDIGFYCISGGCRSFAVVSAVSAYLQAYEGWETANSHEVPPNLLEE